VKRNSSFLAGALLCALGTTAAAQGIQIEFSPAERQRLVELARSPRPLRSRDYRSMAELVFGHDMAADAATARAWSQRQQKKTTHDRYWADRQAAESTAHLAPIWNRLQQDLFENNRSAQRGVGEVLERAQQTGLSDLPRWGGSYRRRAQRQLDRLRPAPRVGERPYTPLRMDATDRLPDGTPYQTRRAPGQADFPGAPHILTGVADWWARQPEDVRKLTNQALSELRPSAQRALLKELAHGEIQDQLRRPAPNAHRDSRWHRAFPPSLRAALQKESPAKQEAIRGGLNRLDRAGWRQLDSTLGRMDMGGAPGSAMLNMLQAKALPRSDSLGRKSRAEADLVDGRLSFDAYARILEPQARALAKQEQRRAAQDERDRRREFVDTLQRTQADPGLAERGQRYAKMWEVINRTPTEELAAFGKGFGKQGVDTVSGIANMVAHPIDTATGIYHLSQNPELILVALDDASVDGDEFAGRLLFELALAAVTAGPKGAPLSAADKARRAAQMSKAAANSGKLGRARKLAKLAKNYADEAVKRGHRDGSGARHAAAEASKHLEGGGQAPPARSIGLRGALETLEGGDTNSVAHRTADSPHVTSSGPPTLHIPADGPPASARPRANRTRGPPADATRTLVGTLDSAGDFPVGAEVRVPRSDGSVSRGVVEARTPEGLRVRVPTADGSTGTKILPPEVLAAHNVVASAAPSSLPKSLFPVGQRVDVPRTGGGKTPGEVLEHYPNGNVKVGFEGHTKILSGDDLAKANPGRLAQQGHVPAGYTRKVGDIDHLPDGAILPSKGNGPAVSIDASHPALADLLSKARKLGKGWGGDLAKVKKLQALIKSKMPDRLQEWQAFEASQGGKGVLSLGEYFDQGCGVCKQNALATQVGLQEMNIPSRYVRGVVDKGGVRGGHAWVEAKIGGKWYVLDSLWDHWNLMPAEQAYGRPGITPDGSRLVTGPEISATLLVPNR
jgi:transglutaminase superfamily protein